MNGAGSRTMKQKYCQRVLFIFYNDTSNIPNLLNPNVNWSLASQKKCDNMFSYQNKILYFHIYWVRTWFIFSFFLYVVIIHLLWRREDVWNILFIDSWLNRIYPKTNIISCQIQNGYTEPNSKYCLKGYFNIA